MGLPSGTLRVRADPSAEQATNQQQRPRLSIILMAPSLALRKLDRADLEEFHSHRLVEMGPGRTAGETRVAGWRQATASIVSHLEDHAFPVEDRWAELLPRTHQQPWGAVAPTLENGNPGGLFSWASNLLCFGIWARPASPTSVPSLPWRNTSYRRSVLLDIGAELAELFVAGFELNQDLVHPGYRLYLDPDTRPYHHNFTHLRPMLQEPFIVGRVLGVSRARRWSWKRRLLGVLGGPLIPRIGTEWRREATWR